jgi:hypothetical protein
MTPQKQMSTSWLLFKIVKLVFILLPIPLVYHNKWWLVPSIQFNILIAIVYDLHKRRVLGIILGFIVMSFIPNDTYQDSMTIYPWLLLYTIWNISFATHVSGLYPALIHNLLPLYGSFFFDDVLYQWAICRCMTIGTCISMQLFINRS